MTVDEQLLYESRVRPRYAAVAVTAGVLLVVAAAIQLSGPQTSVSELTLGLLTANKGFTQDLIAAVISAVALILTGVTLNFLLGTMRARNPNAPPYLKPLALGGPIIAGVAGVANQILVGVQAHKFATTGNQTYMEAKHLTSGAAFAVVPNLGLFGALLLAVAFVLISLQAMRVGLLTRFMGYLGIFAGVLVLFQITQIPVVQAYWLFALGYLLSGRWPTGVPPAWQSGKAEPWPSTQELRARRQPPGGGGAGRGKPAPEPAAEPVGASSARTTRSATPKRKRKRRR
jgi:hypothetical protein